MRNQIIDPTQGSLLKKIIPYAIPIMATNLLQLLFNTADLIIVGRFCGSNSLGAVGATTNLVNLLVNLFMGLSIGAGVTAAHGIGAKNDSWTSRVVHSSLPVAGICGLILMAVGLSLSTTMLEMMGTPEEVLDLAALYMRIYFVGMPSTLLCNFGIAILRAAGDNRHPLMYLSLAGFVNVILNVILVVFFDLDVAGVAIATTASNTMAAILVLVTLARRKDACRFQLRKMRIDWKTFSQVASIGLPAGLQACMFSISNVLIQSSVNSFGAAAVSGNAAAGNLESFVAVIQDCFSITALNFTGLCIGAKRYDRVNKVLFSCIGCIVAVGIPLALVGYFLGKPLLGIYITDSAEAIAFGMLRLKVLCFGWFLCGIMGCFTSTFRGMGYSMQPMLISIIGVCVFRVVWIYTFFARYHTFGCLMVSYPITYVITIGAQIVLYLILRKKMRRKIAVTV